MPGVPVITRGPIEPVGGGVERDPTVLTWAHTVVDGHRVRYGISGDGPAALFLHGWGLRPHAYRRPIASMGAAGCRVYAPAMPGFGGTGELAVDQRSFAGYAAWVGRFLDAVGQDEVALVAGHSFGGGVATAFVHDHPGRAKALLLANAIGSPTWAAFPDDVRTTVQRPIWDWGRQFGADLLHSRGLMRLVPTLIEGFVPNLVQNPLGMFRAGEFIRRADLVAEMRTIAGRNVPVLVAWSDRDGLVSRSAFDDLRHAAGVEGVVVEGSHAWLIADPAAFGELAISALVDSGVLTARPALRVVIGLADGGDSVVR